MENAYKKIKRKLYHQILKRHMFIPVRNKYSLYKKIKIKNNLRIKNIIQFYVYFRAYCLSLFLQNCTNKIYKCV